MRNLGWFLVFWAAIVGQAFGQMTRPEPMVIDVAPNGIYVDVGQRNGLTVGDVLEVYRETQPFRHPETGEVLGDYPIVIGMLKVSQVFEKYAIGKEVFWSQPEGIKEKDRIWFPNGGPEVYRVPSRMRLLIPGLYQFDQKKEGRGVFFLCGVLGLAGSGIYFELNSRDAHDRYLALADGVSQAEFDVFYNRYRINGKRANVLLLAAGGLYLANILDGLLHKPVVDVLQTQQWQLAVQPDRVLLHFGF